METNLAKYLVYYPVRRRTVTTTGSHPDLTRTPSEEILLLTKASGGKGVPCGGALLDYWHWTGDETYNNLSYEGLLFQSGPNKDFVNSNWSFSLGNDDQAFWAMSALIAAETSFRDPPAGEAQWLALAQAVWNEQTDSKLRDGGCGFGLRWQANSLNPGFSYKNSTLHVDESS